MITDGELLERYASEDAQGSFSELVRLRAGFVHATARRSVGGDTHLANDVTQQVFIALARNARRLCRHPVLSGWLYLTTRNLAAHSMRTERRRRDREKESVIMQEVLTAAEPHREEAAFCENLDLALAELNERDRQAVLLRFFENRSFAEIAELVQLTENAARMRVDRALEKLHAAFSRRGITSTATTLSAGLATHASVVLPTTFTTTLAQTALANAAIGAGTAGITFMSLTKLQTAVALVAVGLGISSVVFHEHTTATMQRQIDDLTRQTREITELRAENFRLRRGAAITDHDNATPRKRENLPEAVAVNVSAPVTLPAKRPPALAPGLTPVADLDHSSRATARAAFSTQLWAAAQGDVDLEQSSLLLTPEARARLDAVLASLPAPDRERYGTPERLMAAVLAGSPHPVGGVKILSETPGDDRVIIETQWQHADDGIVHRSNVELQQDDAGNWRMVVPMILVDRAVAYLNGNVAAKLSPQKK